MATFGKEATVIESRQRRQRQREEGEQGSFKQAPSQTTAAGTGALAGAMTSGVTTVQEATVVESASFDSVGGGGSQTTAPPAPVQEDPWARLADILAGGFATPGISVPETQQAQVGYAEGGVNPLAILLVLGAAGVGYWWYTKRRKGGGS